MSFDFDTCQSTCSAQETLAFAPQLRHSCPMSSEPEIHDQSLECLSQSDLIIRIAKYQDKLAFSLIFEQMAPRVKGYLVKSGASPQQAEDVMQDVMIKIWRKAASFNPEKASASTWIFTIARNTRIDVIRREKRPEIDPDDPALRPTPEKPADEVLSISQQGIALQAAMAQLPEKQKQIIQLCYYGDLSHAQIAKQADIPLGTVKSRIRLALASLKSVLE